MSNNTIGSIVDDEREVSVCTGYCWGYQHVFQVSAQNRTVESLEQIKFSGAAQLYIVGVDFPDDRIVRIGAAPEIRSRDLTPLKEVARNAKDIHARLPGHKMFYSDPKTDANYRKRLKSEAVGEALGLAFEEISGGAGVSFASNPVPVEGLYVYVIIVVPEAAYKQVPRLQRPERDDGLVVYSSLVDATIQKLLQRFSQALNIPNVSMHTGVESTTELVRAAAESFMRSIIEHIGGVSDDEPEWLFTAVSILPYEGRVGAGRLILSNRRRAQLDVRLELAQPVSLRNSRAIRKLLEAAGDDFDLLADSAQAFGFGSLRSSSDTDGETAFAIDIVERGHWECSTGATRLISVRDGRPSLPLEVMDYVYLEDILERTFGKEFDYEELVKIANSASKCSHGAMLVISSAASDEAARLSPQTWQTKASKLGVAEIGHLADVDGALVVDSQGYCHDFGAILDGIAAGKGDPSRGSRYNNVDRYLKHSEPAVVITFSEDGLIDIFPKLHSRVYKSDVSQSVESFLEAVDQYLNDGRNGDRALLLRKNELWKQVKAYSFYLTPEQCTLLNSAQLRLKHYDESEKNFVLIESELRPSREMNDSYFLSE